MWKIENDKVFLRSFPGDDESTVEIISLSVKSIKKSLMQTTEKLNECQMNNLELKSRVMKLELAIGNN